MAFYKFWCETVFTRKRNPSHDLLLSFLTHLGLSILVRTIVKAFVEFGYETSYTKSSSHAEFKT